MKYNFKAITLRSNITTRGGGVEIDLTTLGFEGHKMAAYQNYLGGGLLGAVCVNDTIRSQETNIPLQLQWSSEFSKLDEIGEELKKYFHHLTNPDDQEWESMTYDENQKLPESGY